MPRMTPIELCIANLRGDFPPEAIGYQTEDDALLELKQRTGQDFGKDAAQWERWLQGNPESIPEKAKTASEALKLARALKPRTRTRRDN